MKRTDGEYYIESKRIRNEVLLMAEALIEHPMRFTITNGITMDVEITKSDLKTVLSKNGQVSVSSNGRRKRTEG